MDMNNQHEAFRITDIDKDGHELRKHGDSSFPIAVYDNYHKFPFFSKHIMDLHWHSEMEIIRIRRGIMQLRVDKDEYILGAGDIFFIPPNNIHFGKAGDLGGYDFESVVFGYTLLGENPLDQSFKRYIHDLRIGKIRINPEMVGSNPRIVKLYESIVRWFNEKSYGFELMIKGQLLMLFGILFNEGYITNENVSGTRMDYQHLKAVLGFIRQNYTRKITVDQMAELSNYSKYYFIRVFQRVTGRTPTNYLNYYRVQQALKLLDEDSLKIIDIAQEVGFNDLSYFVKVFHSLLGFTPSQYRRSLK